MSVKHKIRYEAEEPDGNILSGIVKVKTFPKAYKAVEVILEQIYGVKILSSIKLECLT